MGLMGFAESSTDSGEPSELMSAEVCAIAANGSRECAPDDRLREAIQLSFARKDGLLRR
jgi:hypothetical protein